MGLKMGCPIRNHYTSITELSIAREELFHKTPSRNLQIEKFIAPVPSCKIETNPSAFSSLCKSGCRNYGNKYSCPPFSPKYSDFLESTSTVRVICYRLNLEQFAPIALYSRIRAGNSVLKSLIDKELRSLKTRGVKVAGSGSCRACKVCAAKLNVPCKKPDRKIYSLEALGVNVDSLVEKLFAFELEWYLPGRKPPAYTCTVGAVFL